MTDYRRQLEKAVGAVYAEADLRLARAQMDLLHPETAPHNPGDVQGARRAQERLRARENARAVGRYYGGIWNSLNEAMQQIAEGFRQAQAGARQAGQDARTAYTLGGPK
ncbi:MAG: hypothetical protein QJR09_11985 [Micrococcus sp.]|nr:hypothetical protein [Micrococcus sp.]